MNLNAIKLELKTLNDDIRKTSAELQYFIMLRDKLVKQITRIENHPLLKVDNVLRVIELLEVQCDTKSYRRDIVRKALNGINNTEENPVFDSRAKNNTMNAMISCILKECQDINNGFKILCQEIHRM